MEKLKQIKRKLMSLMVKNKFFFLKDYKFKSKRNGEQKNLIHQIHQIDIWLNNNLKNRLLIDYKLL